MLPYRPALQFVQAPHPASLYVPGEQMLATGDVELAGQ